MAITVTQQAEILRFLGYPVVGVPQNVANVTGAATLHNFFRIWEPYEWLLTRFNALTQDEEVQALGIEHSAFGSYLVPASLSATIVGNTPVVGSELQFQINGSLETYVVQTGDNPTKIAAAVAALVALDANVNGLLIANPEGPAMLLYARTPGSSGNGVPVQAFSSDPSMTVQIGTGTAAQVVYGAMAGGTDPPGPRFIPQNSTSTVYGYIPILRILEADLIGVRGSLQTDKVDVLTFRKTELSEREALMNWFKRELADRINVPYYPDFTRNRSRGRRRVC